MIVAGTRIRYMREQLTGVADVYRFRESYRFEAGMEKYTSDQGGGDQRAMYVWAAPLGGVWDVFRVGVGLRDST